MKLTLMLWGVAAAWAFTAPAQTPADHRPSLENNKFLIGLTVKHRPDFHCINGSERPFLVDVSKRRPKLIPILPSLAGPLSGPYAYPLMLDSLDPPRGTTFNDSGSQSAATSFAGWFDKRRTVLVLRGSPFGRAPDDCDGDKAKGIKGVNDLAEFDAYVIPLANPSAASSPTKTARGQGANRDNERLQPLKSPTGSQVGWIFRSNFELWSIDMKGEHATQVAKTGVHGCSLSPVAPILACEDSSSGDEINILGVRVKVLGGSYWDATWAPDGSGFVTRKTIDQDPNLTIYYHPVDPKTAVVGRAISVVPSGWTPSGCCTGDFLHYDPSAKKYCPSMNREGFDKRSYSKYDWANAAGCPVEGQDPRPENSGWPWGSEVFAWSRNARWIYYSATKPRNGRMILKVSVRDPKRFEAVTDGIVRDAVDPQISPDGEELAFLSTGPGPKPEPGSCPTGSTEEFNVQLYTICISCEHRKQSLRQKTHLGCNTMIEHMIWR